MLKKSEFSEKCLACALCIFLFLIVTAALHFSFGIGIGSYTVILGAVILLAVSFYKKSYFAAMLLNFAIIAVFAFICRYMFDWSYDGMYYHKQAVITLKEGWNPLRYTAISRDVFASYPDMSLWLENYPKGLWTFSALIYALTNKLETAKAVNILFVSAVYFSAFDAMRKVFSFSRPKSAIFALLFALNPVFVGQLFTFGNDLAVGALFIIAVFLCLKLYNDWQTVETYLCLFCVAAISPTIKFTAPFLIGLVYIVFGIACAIKNRKNIKWLIKPVVAILCGFLIGVFVLGFDPYVEHIKNGQHIVHPAMGDEKYDIMNTNRPGSFDEENSVERLVKSIFSKSSNDLNSEPTFKMPFSVYSDEIPAVSNSDTRIGGFGVFFSGILILSAMAAGVSAIFRRKIRYGLKIIIPMIFVLTLFFPESWWARYASFIYYLPLFLFVYVFGGKKTTPIFALFSLIIASNVAITGYSVVLTGIETTQFLNKKLQEIKSENKTVILRVNDFPTHVKLFSEYGIDFEVYHQSISPGEKIFYRNTKYKFKD